MARGSCRFGAACGIVYNGLQKLVHICRNLGDDVGAVSSCTAVTDWGKKSKV